MKRILSAAAITLLLTGITSGAGKEVGDIGSVNSAAKEVIVNTKSGTDLKMGDKLEIQSGTGKIILMVTFPMMTTSKCKIHGKGKISELRNGMAVYRYNKDELAEDTPGKAGETENFGNIEMVKIPGGTYIMGSPKKEKYRKEEEKQHKVKVSSFWMGKYEVTQKEYRDVAGENPSEFKDDKLPVENINWYQAVEFCNKLSLKQGLKPYYKIDKYTMDPLNTNRYDNLKYTVTILGGNGFRLPTEAEWEYACRGGTKTVFHYGDKLDSTMANFKGTDPYNAEKGIYRKKTTPVGSFKPNAYGLYDMHGNVEEFCWDWYGNYTSVVNDPQGVDSGSNRVSRGGTYSSESSRLRSAYRSYVNQGYTIGSDGIRLAKNL